MNNDDSPRPDENVGTNRAPRWLKFSMLSALWFFPSLGAVVILAITSGVSRAEGQGFREWALSVPIERWVAAGIVCSHVVFISLAIYYWRKEK